MGASIQIEPNRTVHGTEGDGVTIAVVAVAAATAGTAAAVAGVRAGGGRFGATALSEFAPLLHCS